MRQFTMTLRVHNQLLSRLGKAEIKCHKCGQTIETGDKVISQALYPPNGISKTKHYHKTCYDNMFI